MESAESWAAARVGGCLSQRQCRGSNDSPSGETLLACEVKRGLLKLMLLALRLQACVPQRPPWVGRSRRLFVTSDKELHGMLRAHFPVYISLRRSVRAGNGILLRTILGWFAMPYACLIPVFNSCLWHVLLEVAKLH